MIIPPWLVAVVIGLIVWANIPEKKSVINAELQQEMQYQIEDAEFEKNVVDFKNSEEYKKYGTGE